MSQWKVVLYECDYPGDDGIEKKVYEGPDESTARMAFSLQSGKLLGANYVKIFRDGQPLKRVDSNAFREFEDYSDKK
ncbi:MAG TPA: hypothetical protein VFT74_14635 [Isosphaeraceae bacterium]|nr:hypothetical protein [Isosphaeraceae bacterium]